MKLFLIKFFIFLILSSIAFAQAGSVELRTGGGTLVNTYSSITGAYNAIPTPLTQSYVIEILPAYNNTSEPIPIFLTNKDGASVDNTITIRPAAGNSGKDITASMGNNSILIFDGANFVILDGRPGGIGNTPDFKIENLVTTGITSHTVLFRSAASNNIIRYIQIKNNTQDSPGPKTIMFGEGDACLNNLIENIKIEGGGEAL